MNSIIIYLVQSAAILAVLYSVYWLFLRKDTFFHVNRFYLLSSLLLAMIVPLLDIRIFTTGPVSTIMVMLDPVLITSEKIENVTAKHLTGFEIAGVIYVTGVAIFTLRFLIQLIQLAIIVKRNKITHQEGSNLVFVDKGYSPFSFFNLIFIRKEYYVDGKLTPVLEHEKIHIRQYHTLDLLLIETGIILQWFNPFAWFLGRSVKSIHEFLADEGVLKKGFLKNEYQTLILNEAMGLQVNNLTNNFNVSLIKTRITMMTKARSASWTLVKVAFALPAFFAVLFLLTAGSNNSLTAQDTRQKAKSPVQQQEAVAQEKPSSNDPVFEEVETMPTYPGGQSAMITYLVQNIKYPPEAKEKGIQGTVFVSYIVEKDGTVSHVKVMKGVGSGIDEEAVRVVSGMPKWNPGKNDGKAVRVQVALPIKFSLEDKADKSGQEMK